MDSCCSRFTFEGRSSDAHGIGDWVGHRASVPWSGKIISSTSQELNHYSLVVQHIAQPLYYCTFYFIIEIIHGLGSSVGIATDYRLDGL